MSVPTTAKSIVITGGHGNLGSKLCQHLLSDSNYRIILIEHPSFLKPQQDDVTVLALDLGDPKSLPQVEDAFRKHCVDAVVHFSAVNPYPNASWGESAESMDHTFGIFMAAVRCGVRRVIFASSNHVMGGYKDSPSHGPSSIHPSSIPRVGTVPLNPKTLMISGDAKGYAAAKLAGERLAMTLGNLYGDTTSFVVLRIGWCQPGENLPTTLSAAGSPPEFLSEGGETADSSPEHSEGDEKDEVWFKQMWLSNRDFLSYFVKSLEMDVPATEHRNDLSNAHGNIRRGFVLLNAMSANSGAKWNLDETTKFLGVVSEDNSFQ